MSASERSARILSGLMMTHAGHPLSFDRRHRIETALAPVIRAKGFAGIDALVDSLCKQKNERLEIEVVEALLNNETFFFRDRMPFELVRRFITEDLAVSRRSSRRLKIWCAGVSTGQEAYSLAMMIAELGGDLDSWAVNILGTDISKSALARAQAGVFTQFEVQRGLPTRLLLKYFEQTGVDWRLLPSMRARVQFRRQDVTREPVPGVPPFDIIFCRNLLLYLPKEARRALFETLSGSLAPGGALVLGAAETILGQTDQFEAHPSFRGIYRRKTGVANQSPRAMSA